MDEATRFILEKLLGMTEVDIAKVSPNILKLLAAYPRFQKYRIIAEVSDVRYCGAGIKPGQKYIFRTLPPLLIPQESDCPLCIKALGPLTSFISNILDRVADGREPEGAIFGTGECLDPGLEHGGLGKVYFNVYVQRREGR